MHEEDRERLASDAASTLVGGAVSFGIGLVVVLWGLVVDDFYAMLLGLVVLLLSMVGALVGYFLMRAWQNEKEKEDQP